MPSKLYMVIPCYNEEEVLPETAKRLQDKYHMLIQRGAIAPDSRIVFVNDGSRDATWSIIERLHRENSLFSGINLTRNYGHQHALLAGLMTVYPQCDVTISMDADLQDDINAIDEMLVKYEEGCDIVYGARKKRETDSLFKRSTAQWFYKIINKMGGDVVYNHADYRLMSKRALEGLAQFKEVNLFLRGLVPMVGFKSDVVYYDRGERFAGESKYPLRKMLSLALEGITSLSIKPMRMITLLGIVIFAASVIMLIYFLIRHWVGGTVVGWTSMVVSIWAFGGLQLLAIGVVGEYVGKAYIEAKGRPRYLIEAVLHDEAGKTP